MFVGGTRHRRLALTGVVALALATLAGSAGARPANHEPIPSDPITDAMAPPPYEGAPATPRPLDSFPVPRHPFMAPNQRSNVHDDAYMTDAPTGPGPLGHAPEVISTLEFAECGTVTFDRAGRIVTVCVGIDRPRLKLFDPVTLHELANLDLPPRQLSSFPDFLTDVTGGGYFYLDHLDQAVVPTTDRDIWVVSHTDSSFTVERVYDTSASIPSDHSIVSVLPDWNGTLWFVTTEGLVGTVNPDTGAVQTLTLDGERIVNSFAVDETGGVFVVSDVALYRFDLDRFTAPPAGEDRWTWRTTYDRGSREKSGQFSQGSGTTPTVIAEDLVAITDNADPLMNVDVYRRSAGSGGGLVCQAGVFPSHPNESATENSLIAVGNALVVENNYGYEGPSATIGGRTTEPGLARVDVDAVAGTCEVAWESQEVIPSVVSKVSLATGLVYTYTKPPQEDDQDAWFFTAVDFRTGETVFRRLVGVGFGFNNNYAPVTLGPDGTAYVGVLGGLVAVRDTAPGPGPPGPPGAPGATGGPGAGAPTAAPSSGVDVGRGRLPATGGPGLLPLAAVLLGVAGLAGRGGQCRRLAADEEGMASLPAARSPRGRG